MPLLEQALPYIVPSAIALIGVLVGHFLLSRRDKQENDTNAFNVVTDKLMLLVKNAEERITKLETEVKELRATVVLKDEENGHLHEENSKLHGEIAEIRADLAGVTRTNLALGAYLGKLIRLWPMGVALPHPDDPLELPELRLRMQE